MRRLLLAAFIVLVVSPALLGGVARADSTATVTFDDLANGTTVSNQYAAADGLYFQGTDGGGGTNGVTPTVIVNPQAPSQPQRGADPVQRLRRADRRRRCPWLP